MIRTPMTAAILSLALGAAAQAQDALVTFHVLTPELAQRAATVAMETCREQGYQVGVMVTDRFGLPQAFVRDRFAGAHVFETAHRKAWTAVSFRTSTTELDVSTRPGTISAGIRNIGMALPLGGGLMIVEGDGSIVGGIGVSGAPGPDLDDVCAQAGIDAIEEDIAF